MNIIKESDKISSMEDILGKILAKIDTQIVEIEYQKEDDQQIIRVYIDIPQGVDFNNCTQASKLIKTAIDSREDWDYDFLEVSSPGIDRILKKEQDFLKFKGDQVKVSLQNILNEKPKSLIGILHNFDAANIVLQIENELVEISRTNILTVRLHPHL